MLWEIPFYVLFLIVLFQWFTTNYPTIYENMRNENIKSFSGRAFFCYNRFSFSFWPSPWIHPFSLPFAISEPGIALFPLFFHRTALHADNFPVVRPYAPACDIIMCISLIVSDHESLILKKYVLQHRYGSAL